MAWGSPGKIQDPIASGLVMRGTDLVFCEQPRELPECTICFGSVAAPGNLHLVLLGHLAVDLSLFLSPLLSEQGF